MALSDCEKCQDTPCMCGHRYRNWTMESRLRLAHAVLPKRAIVIYEDPKSTTGLVISVCKGSEMNESWVAKMALCAGDGFPWIGGPVLFFSPRILDVKTDVVKS